MTTPDTHLNLTDDELADEIQRHVVASHRPARTPDTTVSALEMTEQLRRTTEGMIEAITTKRDERVKAIKDNHQAAVDAANADIERLVAQVDELVKSIATCNETISVIQARIDRAAKLAEVEMANTLTGYETMLSAQRKVLAALETDNKPSAEYVAPTAVQVTV